MSEFFIKRPIFAWVLAIIAVLAGLVGLAKMPIEQYPNIAPPAISISTSLPGASADTLENSVTQIIEQSLTGIDSLRYFSSSSDSDGNVSITLTFEPGTDPDIAQVQVQNKIQASIPLLPQQVQQQGIRVNKSNNNFLMVIGLYSEDGSVSQFDLDNILFSQISDHLGRIDGVGSVNIFGNPRAMRIWLDPFKLYKYKISTSEVINAIRTQNSDVSAGQIGGLPAIQGQEINATISAQSKLQTVADFEKIILKATPIGAQIYLKDVAKVELGSQSYNRVARYKRNPASGIAINLASGANALKTSALVKEKVEQLKTILPAGVKVIYPYDSTPFIKLSIKGVVKTLLEAIFLVFLVMLLFLQNFRATFIPGIAVPVVLFGTIGVLAAFGFTINTLTMFAIVLSIGLLVDDAIVVVENVERIIHEEDLSPKEATIKSMKQISSALIGTTAVLIAVFIPMAFFSGSAGKIYQQFSVTMAASMVLSILVALILSPSLCATILKSKRQENSLGKYKFFAKFSLLLDKSRQFYVNQSGLISNRSRRFIGIYAAMLLVMFILFYRLPTSFLPTEDQGAMYLMLNTQQGATMERTVNNLKKVEDYFLANEQDTIDHLFTIGGFSFAGRAQNVGFGFIGLKDWNERLDESQHVQAISGRAMANLSQIKDANVFTFFPPPIRELGNASGFSVELLNQGNLSQSELEKVKFQFLKLANENPKLVAVRPNSLPNAAELKIDIDYEKAASLGVAFNEINQTLQTAWGSSYINDFIDSGRIKRVYIQGQAKDRMMPDDLKKWYVKNNNGQMISFASFSNLRWSFGSPKLERFNGISSMSFQGSSAPKVSSGDVIEEVEKIVKNLPAGIDYAWSGLSYEEKRSGSQTKLLYFVSILVIFLALAALYESWSIPFCILFMLPFGMFGSVVFSTIFDMNNDVYFQIGLLTTIGLSAKNAILIVEFARTLQKQGSDIYRAALDATYKRFRPIIMTSMAFVLGVLPLALATGAGSASQKAIGIGVVGGVLTATFLAVFFVPMFIVLVDQFSKKLKINTEITS